MSKTTNIVLDFEMNPVPSKFRKAEGKKSLSSEIIEIGAVRLNDDYEKVDEFSCLIKPEYDDRIEKKITALTGITYEDVKDAECFKDALERFVAWVRETAASDDQAVIYSWSKSDFNQIRHECEFKGIDFPPVLENWKDFQAMFPDITDIHLQRQLSLEYAAQLADLNFDDISAHRATYDAEITGELVRIVMTGEYKTRMAKVRSVLKADVETSTFSLSDKFGSKLMALFEESRPDGESGEMTGESGEE